MSGALHELAQDCGIELSFQASDGSSHATDDETILAILIGLGVPIARAASAADVLRARRVAALRRVIDPVVVHRTDRGGSVLVTLPERFDVRRVAITVNFEDGDTLTERLVPAVTGRSDVVEGDGTRFHRYRVDLDALRRSPLPLGYHAVTIDLPESTIAEAARTARLISAPPCPVTTNVWGVFLPLHALRDDDDWGIGSYTSLAALGQWIDGLGGAMVGGLPLYPSFLSSPIDPSPYRPVSRLAYNELFIDPLALPELSLSPVAQDLLASPDISSRIAAARKAPLVDYETVAQLRQQVLAPLAETFFAETSSRRSECRSFFQSHPELLAYAQYRAHGDAGTIHRRLDDVMGSGPVDPAVGYHLYVQWAAAQQLAQAAHTLPLYSDLPIGVHPDGFDPHWSPISFAPELQVGAPPDAFFAGGQSWGFPPLHPDGIRNDGYGYVAQVLNRALRHSAYLRVDHVMGLQRLYVIPPTADARHGAYVNFHPDELHAVVCLEAQRAGAVVVGEDLGTVPDGVRERMAADRMLRSWVFQFESSTARPLPAIPPPVLASLGTHDLPRFAAHLWGEDLDEHAASGEVTPEAAALARNGRSQWRAALRHDLSLPEQADEDRTLVTSRALRGCLLHLAASAADVVLVDLEDVWGEHEPQNRPGTGPEAGNWRQRAALTLNEAAKDEPTNSLLRDINLARIGAHS